MEPEGSFPCSQKPINFNALGNISQQGSFYSVELLVSLPKTQPGGPPLMAYLRTPIQYSRSYPPYVKAISSIQNPKIHLANGNRDQYLC
jgi:hypothetical protein